MKGVLPHIKYLSKIVKVKSNKQNAYINPRTWKVIIEYPDQIVWMHWLYLVFSLYSYSSRDAVFPRRLHTRPVKTHVNLRIRTVWSFFAAHYGYPRIQSVFMRALCEDCDQPVHLRMLVWILAWRTCNIVGNSLAWLTFRKHSYSNI